MMKKQNTASAKSKRFITNTIVHVILAVLAVIWVIPIAWIIMISFRGESGQYISTLIPKTFTLNNYKKLFTDTQILNFPQMFMNTFIISIFSCVISTFFVLSVSYCMSRMLEFGEKNRFFMGVQWHPEMMFDSRQQKKLFQALVAAAEDK